MYIVWKYVMWSVIFAIIEGHLLFNMNECSFIGKCEYLNAIGLHFSILRLFAIFIWDKENGHADSVSLLLNRKFHN